MGNKSSSSRRDRGNSRGPSATSINSTTNTPLPQQQQQPPRHHHHPQQQPQYQYNTMPSTMYPAGPYGQQRVMHYAPPPPVFSHFPAQYYSNTPHLVAPPRSVTSDSVDTLISGAAVKHNSVKVQAVAGRENIYTLLFVVDSTVASTCTVYIGVRESIKNGTVTLSPMQAGMAPLGPFDVPPGMGVQQTVTIDTSAITPQLMQYDSTKPKQIPFAITLTYMGSTGAPQTYYMYVKIESGEAVTLKELLQAKGNTYELQHVFGAEVVGTDASPQREASPTTADAGGYVDTEEGNMCVVCLSEPKDTTVLPCRHMCMCKECSEIIKRQNPQQCPICRCPIEQLITCRK